MNNTSEKLENMPNIGNVLAKKLISIDIKTPAQLIETGSEKVFLKLKTIDKNACFNMLCAIEGAIQNIRWHNLTDFRKNELLDFYRQFK
ncbi:MAG: TfoX/Sxy family protein [Bacteroidales bacterium]|nr:TfoX/Sxy family protein [Bacteroidales bacterium]